MKTEAAQVCARKVKHQKPDIFNKTIFRDDDDGPTRILG